MEQLGLLIVDDEESAIESVKQELSERRLDFFSVSSASNIAEAKKLIEKKDIHLLLCDIEMPMGTGLDLLEWVNEHHPGIVCVFMTSHAEFSFAQRAVHLGSFEYVLKPIDFDYLERVLRDATSRVMQNEKIRQAYSYLEKGKKAVKKQFWRALYIGDISTNYNSLLGYINYNELDIPIDGNFVPILISPKGQIGQLSMEDQKLLGFALRNMTEELFQMEETSLDLEAISQEMLLVILTLRKPVSEELIWEKCLKSCRQLIDAADRYLHLPLCCYIGEMVGIEKIPEQIEHLQKMDFTNIIAYHLILFAGEDCFWGQNYQWREYISDLKKRCKGSYVKMLDEITDSLEKNKHTYEYGREFLQQFYMGFYTILDELEKCNNFFLTEVIDQDTNKKLSEKTSQSPKVLVEWIGFIKGSIQKLEKGGASRVDPVDQVKEYVKNHLDEISVEILASQVHLNPDYLNRIFKKATGISLSQYLIQQKMNHAKWLLNHTEWTIGEVAAAVGYYNYSSFTRIFSKSVGMSPQEYKSRKV